jgi:hypothetical protein
MVDYLFSGESERILEEMEQLKRWGVKRINMADLIRRGDGWSLYYEQRAAWDHGQLEQLRQAGLVAGQQGGRFFGADVVVLGLELLEEARGVEGQGSSWKYAGSINRPFTGLNF